MLINSAISGRMINNERSIICENEIEESIKKENESKSKGYRGKSIIPLSKEEIPFFSLPSNWCWARLGKMGTIISGNSISKSKRETYKYNVNGIPYIANANLYVEGKKINYEGSINIIEGTEKFRIVSPDEVLICSEGGNAGKKNGNSR